jgi:hypothetical protein
MRSVAICSLFALLLAAPAAAQVNAADMRSGCQTFTDVSGLVSTGIFFVPSGSRFVLTDVTVSRVAFSGPFDVSAAPAIRVTINNGGGTSVPRWISTDRIAATDDPLQIHWTTGIVFEPSAVVEAAVSVMSGPAPTVTICWSGYLTPATTTSVVPRPPSSEQLGLEATPNPSRESTDLSFTLARKQRVTIGVFAVDGRRVRTLQRGVLEAGQHHVTWDGRDDAGRRVADGVYFAGLETAHGQASKRIARIR